MTPTESRQKSEMPERNTAGNPMRARAVPTSQLLLVALGFCVWCSALVFSYALNSVGCAFAWPAETMPSLSLV